jgi:hypothetical protein
MSRSITFESTILGGLPVEVEARIHRAEPDVGIFHEQVEIEVIRWPGRFRQRDRKFVQGSYLSDLILNRMSPFDDERLCDAALEACDAALEECY